MRVLATREGLLHPDGQVNFNAFSRFADIPPATVMRLCKSDGTDISKPVANKLAKAFHITEGQARGYSPIDESKGTQPLRQISERERKLLEKIRALKPKARSEIETYIDTQLKVDESND